MPEVGASAERCRGIGVAAAPAMEKNLYVVAGSPAASTDIPGVKELAERYKAKYSGPDKVFDTVAMYGYSTAAVTGKALEAACEKKDLSRAAIVASHRSLRSVEVPQSPAASRVNAGLKPESYD